MDFCEQVWNNQHLNSQPLCADNVLPTVDFYEKDGNNTVPLCNLNLNDANEGDLSTLCPSLDTALTWSGFGHGGILYINSFNA